MLRTFSSKWTQSDYYDSLVKGALNFRLGNLDVAIANLTVAVEKTNTGGTPLDLSFLAMCQLNTGDLDAAADTINRARKSLETLQQGLTRGLIRESQPTSLPIGDISSWPNYAQSLLVLAEAEMRLAEKNTESIQRK